MSSNLKKDRREFLKKSLKLGSIAGIATIGATSVTASKTKQESGGVVVGTSKKQEVLYSKNALWEKYYKIAY